MDNGGDILAKRIQKLKRYRNIIIVVSLFVIVFFSLKNSLLIDRTVSEIPFNPNIFASAGSAIKDAEKIQDHGVYYQKKMNDSISVFYEISENPERISRAVWSIQYNGLTSENLMTLFKKYSLLLYDKENKHQGFLLSGHEMIFWNQNIKQFLVGSYNLDNSSFELTYYYPRSYKNFDEKNSFSNSLKDRFIGPPF